MKKIKHILKKAFFASLFVSLAFSSLVFAQEADDGFVVPLDVDFSKAPVAEAAPAAVSTGKFNIKQGFWIEATSDNASLIRNVSDGKKKGYEFDNSHLKGKMNWWFWGNVKKLQLDAEVGVFKFDKTLYQANSYADNVPDVTWGDGWQSFLVMPFAFFKEGNDSGIGAFNKIAFNFITPAIVIRLGYGDLKKNGMSEFKGIYTVLDRWNDVGKGYTEIKNGSAWSDFGDVKLDFLAAFSEMRDSYGLYDVIDVKYKDKLEVAATFGSTTTENKLFYYNKNNKNAVSAYVKVSPIDLLDVELHGLGYFGINHKFGMNTSAIAGKLTFKGESWKIGLKQSAAGVYAHSVWGSDGKEYDDIHADSLATQIDAEKSFSFSKLDFKMGLDQGIFVKDSSDFSKGLLDFRCEPYFDFGFGDMSIGVYGVARIDKLAESTSKDRQTIFAFDEAGIEFTATDLAKLLKKFRFDYAVNTKYSDWKEGSSYPLDVFYHSFMAEFTLTDRIDLHAASIIRNPKETDDKNVPFAFSIGATFKKVKILGGAMFWVHFTYSMNPYEDNEYTLFRKDHENNKPLHRTYLLNSLSKETTKSHIAFGFIWDIQ